MSGRLRDKTAIITGAASGIGKAAAKRFAEEGATVVCADINGAGLTDLALEIREAGLGSVVTAVVDVTQWHEQRELVESTLGAHGSIDVLYANAGVAGIGTAGETDLETWSRVMEVNLTGVWLSMRAVLPHMVDAGTGSIITQASVAALVSMAGVAPYAAAKGGVIALTRQAAGEYGQHGVRINAIAPGTVNTKMVRETYRERYESGIASVSPEVALEDAAASYPLRRLGEPREVADVAVFLASDEAAWVTGAVYVVDGGLTAT